MAWDMVVRNILVKSAAAWALRSLTHATIEGRHGGLADTVVGGEVDQWQDQLIGLVHVVEEAASQLLHDHRQHVNGDLALLSVVSINIQLLLIQFFLFWHLPNVSALIEHLLNEFEQ
jgi:hypothetical protein